MKFIIKLRPVKIEDVDLLLEWRNNPETRKASKNTDRVKKNEHLSWLKASLNNNNRKLFIAEQNGFPVGTIRSDYKGGYYELSWTTAPDARGKRVGKHMVAKLAKQIFKPILATIKQGNKASIKIAEYAGLKYDQKKDGLLYYKRRSLEK